MFMNCIFCRIIAKELPSKIEFEDEKSIVIHSIHPLSKVHLLVIPKKHIPTIIEVEDADQELMGHLMIVARNVAKKLGLGGYKLQYNVGKDGGQEVFHIHLHVLG